MITQKNVDMASHISDAAMMNGKRLFPKAGSPLTALVYSIAGIGETGTWEEIIGLSSTTNSTIGSHTEIQDNVAKDVALTISNLINVARNDVNPRIRDCLVAIDEYKTQQAERAVGTLPIVRQVEVEGLLMDEMFLDMASIYRESNIDYDRSKLIEALGMITNSIAGDDEAATLVTTGSKSLDAKIIDFLGSDGIANVKDVAYINTENIIEIPLKQLVMLFLALNGVAVSRLEKFDAVVNDSLLNAAVVSYKANVGRRLFQVITRLTDGVKNNALILPPGVEQVDSEREIVVIGKTYRDWIANKGGSVEAAIGFALLSKAGTGMVMAEDSELQSNPVKFVETYVEYQRHLATMRQSEELVNIPRIIGEYLSGLISKSDIEDSGKVILQERLGRAMANPYYGNTDVVGYVRDVVCATWTEGDNVKRILIDIDDVLKTSGNSDLDYAVFVAICRLYGRWSAGQIEVGV